VPIGGIDRTASTGRRARGEEVAQPPVASAASDFWGEGVQDALHGPIHATEPEEDALQYRPDAGREAAPAPAGMPGPGPEHESGPRPDRQRVRGSRPRLLSAPAVRAARARAAEWRRASAPLTRPVLGVALLGTVAAVIAFTVSAALSGASAAPPAPSTRASSAAHHATFTDPGKPLTRLLAMLAPVRVPPLAPSRRHAAKSRPAKSQFAPAQSRATHVAAASPSNAEVASPPPTTAGAGTSAPPASKPAGPTGPVSLLGAGTTPSG